MINRIVTALKKQWENKKVLIVGLGLQGGGVGLVKFFAQLGAHVKVTDLKNAEELQDSLEKIKGYKVDLILGRHVAENFLSADVIFKGPSVSWTLPYLQQAMSRGIPIEMEVSFFVEHCPGKIIGITGTRGKSTTTMMIYELMKTAGFSVFLGGNIAGVSTIQLLEQVKKNDWVVLELSSWQLSGFHRKKISPHIAVITNFYPDHLNYYQTLAEYWYDKTAIYRYQKKDDILIVNHSLKNRVSPPSAGRMIYTQAEDFHERLKYLQGFHNAENAAQALAVARVLSIDQNTTYGGLTHFQPLAFRLAKIAEIDAVAIYNDSTSTTPIACQKAIESFCGQDIILILGGNSKKLPIEQLAHVINKSVKKIILLKGAFTDEIQPLLNQQKIVNLTLFDDLQIAVNRALAESAAGDVILFSPGATSFAMFRNEFHRGEEFDRLIKRYEKERT